MIRTMQICVVFFIYFLLFIDGCMGMIVGQTTFV